MPIPDSLFSINIEKTTIAGIINHPNVLIDLNNILSDDSFFTKEHRVLFSVIKNMVVNGEKPEKAIIAQKVKDLGLRMDLEIYDYLDAICTSQIQTNGLKDCIKELLKLKIRRDLWNNAVEVQSYIKDAGNKEINEIIGSVDSIYHSKINQYALNDDEPSDLYAELESYLLKIASNPQTESGLITPFNQYNRYFGGLKSKDGGYFFYARSQEGKSVWMFNLSKGTSLINKVPTLYLDSEMSKEMNIFRAGAAEADVNSWMLQTGQWTKNNELKDKVLKSFGVAKKYKGLFYHKFVPNKNIEEIISIIKRFKYKYIGRNNPLIVVYDYFKISGDVDKNRNEWQQLGDKVSFLNEIGHNEDIHMIYAGQQNRSAKQNGVRLDDDTTIAGSDRINQYARFSAIFRRKTLDEIAEHGQDEGTHSLMPTKWSRDQGVEDFNSNNIVKTIDPVTNRTKYINNYICYQISNYGITERKTLKQLIQQQQLQANLQGNHHHHHHNNNQI